MRIKLLVCVFIFLLGCSDREVPQDILQPDKMQSVLFDFLLADELVNEYAVRDTAKKRNVEAVKMYKQVLLIHNINKEQFYKSLRYYQSHPDKNKVLFDSLSSQVKRKSTLVNAGNKNVQLK